MTTEGFAEPKFVISPTGLEARLKDVTVIDVRPSADFARGHIEGAKHFDLYGISLSDTSPDPLNAFFWTIKALFALRGLSDSDPIVVYDHESGERAARAVWLLDVLGHRDARLLDGGTQAWEEAGLGFTRDVVDVEQVRFRGTPDPDSIATRFDVSAAIGDPNCVLLDTRRESEHMGTEKRAKRVGTIPGSVHVFWRDHLDEKGAFRPGEEIRQLYESKGVTPDKTIIPYCQGAYRSANATLVLKMLGYPKVRNYLGSWWEWGNRGDSQIVLPGEKA